MFFIRAFLQFVSSLRIPRNPTTVIEKASPPMGAVEHGLEILCGAYETLKQWLRKFYEKSVSGTRKARQDLAG
jgi:hypothetical protein